MEYWRHVCEVPWFALHPASRRTSEQLSKTIPFGLHGDDVAAFKSSAKYKILAITCNSVCAHLQGSYLSRLPFVMMMYYLMVPDETLNQIWEVLVWSFDCLEEGTWPFRGHKKTEVYTKRWLPLPAHGPRPCRRTLWNIRPDAWRCEVLLRSLQVEQLSHPELLS